jgi:excisionase family DNA binding protein
MAMSEQNPFAPFFDEFRKIIREEIERALNERKPAKLMFTVEEACQMLNVQRSWLLSKVRAGEMPHRRNGHRIYFAQQDIDEIMRQSAVPKNGK